MRPVLLFLILIAAAGGVGSFGMDSTHSNVKFELCANHLVREQLFMLAAILPVYRGSFIDAGYGYLGYHNIEMNAGYRLMRQGWALFAVTGCILTRENFDSGRHYTEWSFKMGGGLEADLPKNFYLRVETSLIDHLLAEYVQGQIHFRETYAEGSGLDYTVVVGLGYRFSF